MPGLECQLCPDKKTLSSLQRLETHVQKMHKGFTASKAKATVQQWLDEGKITVPELEGKTCEFCNQKDINPKLFKAHLRSCPQFLIQEKVDSSLAAGRAAVFEAMDADEEARAYFHKFLCDEGMALSSIQKRLSVFDRWMIFSETKEIERENVFSDLVDCLFGFYESRPNNDQKAEVFHTYQKLMNCWKGNKVAIAFREEIGEERKLIPVEKKVFYSRPKVDSSGFEKLDFQNMGKGKRDQVPVNLYQSQQPLRVRKSMSKSSRPQVFHPNQKDVPSTSRAPEVNDLSLGAPQSTFEGPVSSQQRRPTIIKFSTPQPPIKIRFSTPQSPKVIQILKNPRVSSTSGNSNLSNQHLKSDGAQIAGATSTPLHVGIEDILETRERSHFSKYLAKVEPKLVKEYLAYYDQWYKLFLDMNALNNDIGLRDVVQKLVDQQPTDCKKEEALRMVRLRKRCDYQKMRLRSEPPIEEMINLEEASAELLALARKVFSK